MTKTSAGALRRIRANPALSCVALLAAAAAILYVVPWLWGASALLTHDYLAIDITNKDFVNYWLAGRMSLDGSHLQLFTQETYFARLQEYFGAGAEIRNWSYAPHFLLFLWPLGHLRYAPALGVFLAVTLALFAFAVRAFRANLAPQSSPTILVLALFGYVLVNVDATQNGFLTSAWLLLGLAWMKRRPVLAGLAFACLTVKPQLGLLIPVLLLFDRNWRAIISAAGFTLLLAAASIVVFGVDSWHAYLTETLAYQRSVMTDWHGIFLRMMPTVFGGMRTLDFTPDTAIAVQWPVSGCAFVLLLWLLKHEPQPLRRSFAVLCGTFLVSPYGFNYDMGALSAAAAMLASSDKLATNRASATLLAMLASLAGLVMNLGRAGVPIAPLLLGTTLVVLAIDIARAKVEQSQSLPGSALGR